MKFKYDLLIISGVTDSEFNQWTKYKESIKAHTLSQALRPLLDKFKHLGYAEGRGDKNICISSYKFDDEKLDIKKFRSRAIRHFLNHKTK